MSDARLLAEWFPEFAEHLDKMDETYKEMRTIDEKTYQFICFALAIKARSKPCLLKHFMGALEAGATVKGAFLHHGIDLQGSRGG
jgi:alkylhydroperoxidase/carboxymuconolactone decarboxylase family protein YurZ